MKDLLLLLCHYPFDVKDREILKQLIGEVTDWDKLVKLINDHGIIALATYNIKEAGLAKDIPGKAMTILENGHLKSLARNTWLTEHWKEASTILSNAGIKHILLKGMALEHTLYESKGLRQMNDNDILIHPDEALKAWNLLQNEDFSTEIIKSPLHTKILMEIGNHLPCLYKDGYALEIHERLQVAGSRLQVDPFEDSAEIMIGSTKAFILNKGQHLNYLIDHFERHKAGGNCQLRLYTDIFLLDKNSKIEIPDRFILNPIQENELHYRKIAYRDTLYSIAPKHRFRFLTGDIFPSLSWMKKRYRCTTLRALLYYPFRLGKVFWLLQKG